MFKTVADPRRKDGPTGYCAGGRQLKIDSDFDICNSTLGSDPFSCFLRALTPVQPFDRLRLIANWPFDDDFIDELRVHEFTICNVEGTSMSVQETKGKSVVRT